MRLLNSKNQKRMVNNVTLIGNVGADPEIITFENGNRIANVTLATSKNWKDKESGERKEKTTWHNIQVGGPLVNVFEKYVKKGDRLYISGEIDNYSWTDKDGNKKYSSRISCEKMKMLSSKSDNQQQSSVPTQPSTPVPPNATGSDKDDLPF